MGIKVITPPTGEPVTQLVCERHLERDGAYDSPPATQPDAELIAGMLSAAREHAEQFTSLSLAPQTLELALDRFPSNEIELTNGPVHSITSVTYIDADGNVQTVDELDYVLDDYSDSFWLLPADGFTWPSTQSFVNAVKIRYVAGYSLPDDSPQPFPLPKSIRSALLVALKKFYDFRDTSDFPEGAYNLLRPHRKHIGV